MTWLEQEDERVVDLPAQWGGIIPSEVFLEEAQRIVHEGEKRGLILRVMGGVGIRLQTVELADLGHRLGRLGSGQQEFTDLDGLREIIPGIEELTAAEKAIALSCIESLRRCIDAEPKSLGWKSRAIIGPTKRWYQPVETMGTVGGFGIWRLRDKTRSDHVTSHEH